MSAWRRKALEFIPEKRNIIDSVDSVSCLWVELYCVFVDGIESNDEIIIRNILKYATWCTSEEAGDVSNETHQAVYCGFMEDLTSNRKYFPLFKKWFSHSQFVKYKGSFQYALGEEEYKILENDFYGK